MPAKKTAKKSTPKKETRGRKPGDCGPALDPKAIHTEPGDNTKYIYAAMALWDLPKVDLNNIEAVADRTNTYFSMMAERDMKPTVIGYAMALGIDRRTLWSVVNDQPYNGRTMMNIVPESVDIIKNGYKTMEFLWENYMQNRQIETVSGIFLGKNHYGYKDQSETVVVTPQNLLGSTESPAALEQKYLDSVVIEEE